MNRIKDFIYDKNDLLVALIIVALAALIIAFRVDVIMAYPSSLSANEKPPINTEKPPISDETSMGGSIEEPDGTEGTDGSEEGESKEPDESQPPEDTGEPETDKPSPPPEGEGLISIYIKSGATGSDIAQLLMDAGLIDTKEDFYKAVQAAGADTRLQAGNFRIPSNASPEEIIKIITN